MRIKNINGYRQTNRICLLMILIASLTVSVFTQVNSEQDVFENLFNEAKAATSIKQIGATIKTAEKTHNKTIQGLRNDPDSIGKATLDFALFRINISNLMIAILRNSSVPRNEVVRFFSLNKKNNSETKSLLEKSVEIFESKSESDDPNLASARFELAVFYEQNVLQSQAARGWDKYLEAAAEAQDLYIKALSQRKRLFGENDALVLITVFRLANSYFQSAEYEKALPLYDAYISGIDRTTEPDPGLLFAALRSSQRIYAAIGDSEAADKMEKEIVKIAGAEMDTDILLPLLAPRAKSFKYEGINRMSMTFSNTPPSGVRSNGTQSAADVGSINSIRGRPQSRSPGFGIIVPGRSNFHGVIVVRAIVEVDANGAVTDVQAETDDKKLKNKIEENVKEWQFRPFVQNGVNVKMTGIINYYLKKGR